MIINLKDIDSNMSTVEHYSVVIDDMVDEIVDKYTSELDEYIRFVNDVVRDENNPPSNQELDDFALTIPTLMYFSSQGQESLGVKEDVAKLFKAEAYNKVYGGLEGTIADKKAEAELLTSDEELVQMIYERAYKKVRLKLNLANEVLQSVKKVITRRVSEQDLTRMGGI